MTVEIKNGSLIITMPINKKPKESSSGKTLIVASSGGNKETEVKVEGKPLFVGVNAYVFPE
jgi:hypothetical protein